MSARGGPVATFRPDANGVLVEVPSTPARKPGVRLVSEAQLRALKAQQNRDKAEGKFGADEADEGADDEADAAEYGWVS